jgi:transposase
MPTSGFRDLYNPDHKPGPIVEAACWAHGRRRLFVLADLAKAPPAIEAVYLAKIGDSFEARHRSAGQPHQFDIALGLALLAAASTGCD